MTNDQSSKQVPSVSSLFGSQDFCACEECRSVLSPAAYLVDLLRFLDPYDDPVKQTPTLRWKQFLDDWKATHSGKDYPGLSPYEALMTRRPDIPFLPLTCENTNTVLPYIDLVNEIFEYYIAHEKTFDTYPGYDTGEADSADLVAEPQHILPDAYAILNGAVYPLGLPFDLWLETVRRFVGYFKTPLWRLLDVFKAADSLELFPDANAYPYYRAVILAEELGIAPAEYAVYTNPDPLSDWFKLYGYDDPNVAPATLAATASNDLKSARTLATKLGLSYQELVDLVKTGFLNPQLNALVALQKLGIQPDDVFNYEQQKMTDPGLFEAILDKLTLKYNPTNDNAGFNAKTWLSTTWKNGGFNQILLLADPDATCTFDHTTLQYADGTAPTPSLFLKLNLFARLWKKLGWTLEETDRALQVFLAPNFPPDTDASFGTNYSAAMQTALIFLAHLETLFQELQPGPAGRIGLLTFWAHLPTTGNRPLYAQLFLNSSAVAYDPVFDDPTGNYLTGGLPIKEHLVALQGPLNLTADEVGLILTDAQLDMNTAKLTLETVSLLYRYRLLSQAMSLSVADFIDVKTLSGLQPFAPIPVTPLVKLADDVLWTQTIELAHQARKVKESGYTTEDLTYVLRHHYDPVGKYHLDLDVLLQVVRSLSNTIHQIQAEHAVPSNPLAFTDQVIKQQLDLAFPTDEAETFMRMWTGTIQYTAVETLPSPTDQLDPATLTQFPAIQVFYDPVTQVQRLTYQGVLLDAPKAKIEKANTSQVLSRLLDNVQGQARSYFHDYFQIATIGPEPTGFLPPGDFDLLFAIPDGVTNSLKQAQISQKREELAQQLLQYLQQKLIRQAVVQALVPLFTADASLVARLTTDARLLSDPTQDPTQPQALLEAFRGAAENGVSVTYVDDTSKILATGTVSTVNTAAANTADGKVIKPTGAYGAHFAGYLEVAADGAYRFFAELGQQNAQATLTFDFQPTPLIHTVAAGDDAEASEFVELKAGIPYHFTLDVLNLGGGDASLLVQGENFPKRPLSQLTLYPETAVDRFIRAWVLLRKTLQLIQGFGLNEREVTYLITHGEDFDNLSFSALPTQTSDDTPLKATKLFGQFLRLAAYASLKKGPAGGSDGLIDIFTHAQPAFLAAADSSQTALQDLYQLVANLTRRKRAVVQATAERLGFNTPPPTLVNGQLVVKAPVLAQEQGFGRLWDALQLVQTIGLSADALAATTGIIDRAKTQDERAVIADTLKNAVKAHYTPDVWRRIAQAMFDTLRQKKRDALSSYLIYQLGLETGGQLFEHFLVDPGMEPVVQTSRIRLALSSVQTFIQRCLLNLEQEVAPATINSNQWAWMKRYRVWQANREIFLWPENWMEPEWRLDKTDLFQALESALFQGDVTSDLVEDAFFTYLQDLEGRARLDIVTMYLEEDPLDPNPDTLHVIGRTYGLPQKYFYRRFDQKTWTAWEPIKGDINGDHLAVVMWRKRLHLFWVTFAPVSKPPDLSSSGSGDSTLGQMKFSDLTSFAPHKLVQLQLNWSEYYQGKWSDRTSSDLLPVEPVDLGTDDFNPLGTSIHVARETDQSGNEVAVKIILDAPFFQAFRLVGKNSEPTFGGDSAEQAEDFTYMFTADEVDATKFAGSGSFGVAPPGQTFSLRLKQWTYEPILQQNLGYSVLYCDNPPELPWSLQPDAPELLQTEAQLLGMPFFYADTENDTTLFVQPAPPRYTINTWTGYARVDSMPTYDNWEKIPQPVAQVPSPRTVGPWDPAAAEAIYPLQTRQDWTTDPATAIPFGTSMIGSGGAIPAQKVVGAGFKRPATSTGIQGSAQMAHILAERAGRRSNPGSSEG